MSWDAPVPPPVVEWSGAEVSEYTPLRDVGAVYRCRLLALRTRGSAAQRLAGATPEARAAAGLPDPESWMRSGPKWERPAEGEQRCVRSLPTTLTLHNINGRLVYAFWGNAAPRRLRESLRAEYTRLAVGDRDRVVEHEPRLSPTALAALGGNRGVGRDSLGWDYDPEEMGT